LVRRAAGAQAQARAPLAQQVQRRVAGEVVRHVQRGEREAGAHRAVQPVAERRGRRRAAAA
jgi:hypothetical protein